jgi:hypothetical protein
MNRIRLFVTIPLFPFPFSLPPSPFINLLITMKTSILTRRNPLSSIVLLASILGSLPALADTPSLSYQGANVYKDSKGMVYKVSTADVSVQYDGVQVSKSIWNDACGVVRASFSTATGMPHSMVLNGTTRNLDYDSELRDKLKYKCVNGVADWGGGIAPAKMVRTGEKTDMYDRAIRRTVYFLPSMTGGVSKQSILTYAASLTHKAKPTCGFVVVNPAANPQKRTSTALKLDNTAIDLATLPVNPAPPECVKGKLFTGGGTAAVGGATMYRTAKAVYITGQTAGSINVVKYDALRSRSFKTTQTCGLFAIDFGKESPASIKIGATTYTPATVTSTTVTSCSSAGFGAIMADKLYKNGTDYYYKVTDLTKKSIAVETPYLVTKKIAVNVCGFTTIPSLNMAEGYTTGDKLIVNESTPYDVSTLPLVTTAPLCQNGVIYTSAP